MSDLARLVASLGPECGVLCDGRWTSGSKGVFEVDDPATAELLADVADGAVDDATRVVDAAAAALPAWSALAPRTRSELLSRTRDLVLRDREPLATLIAAENGKALVDARGEVDYAAEFFRWYAEEAVRPHGHYGPSPAGGTRSIVTRRPVGVAALVTPWNFPLAMAARKVAPALAAGCTAVLKPAAETPLSALALGRLLVEAGLPGGVLGIVPGVDAGSIVATWLDDPRVRKLSFTGSTRVGRLLLRHASERVLNTSLELGGAAPFVVAADADIAAVVDDAMVAKFRGGGQACTAANCFFVHADVADEFTAAFGARVAALRVGPSGEGAEVGPLISARAVAELSRRVDDAVGAGARVTHRAQVPDLPGHFFAPVVLVDVDAGSPLAVEESFGPVAPVVTWTDPGALVAGLNENELGLAAYVHAGDVGAAMRLAERLETGMVGVNRGLVSDPSAPFGGTKQSGLGREGAEDGLAAFCETQYLSVAW